MAEPRAESKLSRWWRVVCVTPRYSYGAAFLQGVVAVMIARLLW